MGLDTSHGCWHGSYGAFSRWRKRIAQAAGYAVWDLKYDDGTTRPTVMIDWGHISEANLMGRWDEMPSDPLLVLIAHSDCEGCIYPEQAIPLADRLEGLLPLLDGPDDPGHIGNWKEKTRGFISGLREAASRGEAVEFR